jgi:hypothetical protein
VGELFAVSTLVYQSTGVITRFTDGRDPQPRSREVFTFPRPETLAEWLSKPQSLRARLQNIPPLDPAGFRACQITAIKNLENSFKADRPRALMQMATGSGKTFTAISSVYRLLKHADAKRILFLVDTRNLGHPASRKRVPSASREPTGRLPRRSRKRTRPTAGWGSCLRRRESSRRVPDSLPTRAVAVPWASGNRPTRRCPRAAPEV